MKWRWSKCILVANTVIYSNSAQYVQDKKHKLNILSYAHSVATIKEIKYTSRSLSPIFSIFTEWIIHQPFISTLCLIFHLCINKQKMHSIYYNSIMCWIISLNYIYAVAFILIRFRARKAAAYYNTHRSFRRKRRRRRRKRRRIISM